MALAECTAWLATQGKKPKQPSKREWNTDLAWTANHLIFHACANHDIIFIVEKQRFASSPCALLWLLCLIVADVFHWRCLQEQANKLPPHTAPAGHVCTVCEVRTALYCPPSLRHFLLLPSDSVCFFFCFCWLIIFMLMMLTCEPCVCMCAGQNCPRPSCCGAYCRSIA